MLLFTPGPTPVFESVRQAMAAPTIHHRTPEFEEIFAQARNSLFELFGMEENVMLCASGTGAMQACVLNLCKARILTINAGKFGERFGKIADAMNISKVELCYEWNTPADPQEVRAALEQNPDIDALAIQVSESAGGLRHPIEEIAKIAKGINPNIMVIADGITAVGVEPIDVSNIDALIAGSQKAFMLPPGLAMIGLSKAALERIDKGRDYYFNLAIEIKSQRKNTTAWTAATTLIIGLNAMFDEIKKSGGFEVLYDDTKRRARAVRASLSALGLEIYPNAPALSMTTIIDEQAEEIRKILKTKYQVNIAGGQDHLKGKIFRINQMGLIPAYEMVWVLNAIELALDETGQRAFNGEASRIFNEIYSKGSS